MVINTETIKSMPIWFLRLVFIIMVGLFGVLAVYGVTQTQKWVELVSLHVATTGDIRITAIENRTDRLEDAIIRLRADQLSKFMWDAMRATPPDRAKAAEWEAQLRDLLLTQSDDKMTRRREK